MNNHSPTTNHQSLTTAFTLIELIIVIVLLSIIAVFALPRLMDPVPKARQSATDAVAGALTAASANNYAIRKANATKGQAVTNCTDVGNLPTNLLPTGYTITALAIANNAAATCTVTNPDGTTTATFVGLGIT
ncbi:MAG: prepilin-type N-terminal cleavage/methylation domain-containing protein [Gammaproteobacteria bacterium]|nr:prepilin-type N-terminal cleavage/methylation domain-containing protein [Gammaproteobacteria bacterium]